MENNALSTEEMLKQNGEYISQTQGYSMMPMLRHRTDTVVVVPAKNPLKKYDVALYRTKEGKLILHRIIGKKSDGTYIIRGDNRFELEYVPQAEVFGVLKEFYRNGKKYVCDTDWRYRVYIRLMMLDYPRRWLKQFLKDGKKPKTHRKKKK